MCVENRDHRALRLPDDALDQLQSMRRAGAETHEGDIGAFARGQPADVDDLRGVCDDGMTESGDELREQDNALLPLVRDQYA